MLSIIRTSDESHTILDEVLGETYHSVHGAVQESRHVFVYHGLYHGLRHLASDPLSILEVGMGTGLNVLLTAISSQERAVDYTAIEPHPLSRDLVDGLNYPNLLGYGDLFHSIHEAAWEKWDEIRPGFRLRKWSRSVMDLESTAGQFDLVYYDAFAPRKQPEMWTAGALGNVVTRLNTPGIFVTYAATGQLRRELKAIGLEIERLPGAPGKREMTRAVKH